jgi:hypothetical protein
VCQNGTHLLDTQDDWELLLAWGAYKGQRGPFSLEGLLVEELDAAQRNGACAPRVVLDGLNIEEIVTQFFLCDLVRGFVLMFRQLAYGPDVHLLSALG